MEAETQPNRSYVEKEGEKEGSDQFRREVVFGDVLWVKLHGSSWWPAQVVDENTVSGSIKPSNRQVDEVLVRLYGSYKYFFVDPIRCCLEFKNILKENNDSYLEILKKALEQDLSRIKSGRSKGRGSNAKSRISPRISVAKTPPTKLKNGNLLSEKNDKAGSTKRKQEGKKNDPSSAKSATTSEGKSRELSARKMRVMQNLGLIAPSGSPFHRNGYISPS